MNLRLLNLMPGAVSLVNYLWREKSQILEETLLLPFPSKYLSTNKHAFRL